MIQATIKVRLPASRLKEAMAILRPLVEATKTVPGCIDCELHRDVLHTPCSYFTIVGTTRKASKLPEEALGALVRQVFPMSPKGIIDHLKLRQPGYLQTAAYGHFGRPEFAWERTDATDELLAKARKA